MVPPAVMLPPVIVQRKVQPAWGATDAVRFLAPPLMRGATVMDGVVGLATTCTVTEAVKALATGRKVRV